MSVSEAPVSPPPARFVLGTAGHIDHGKTALVRALTGTDTDRLPEEKERGITIELGFASLDLAADLRMSVIDVPGHERFVRTMVSGATGIDLVLLVVAADEGVMPQTREHLAICELLGIDRGVVALTKIDCVDEEMRELATADLQDLLAGTPLSGSPVVPVSSTTGEGVEVLREKLAQAVRDATPRTDRSGPARLGIDRVFAIRGFGTVVTGTLVGRALEVGQKLRVYPSGLDARIRGLQSHGHEAKRIEPGVRCAVNLQGVETAELSRGESLGQADALVATLTVDVEIRWLQTAPPGDEPIAIEFLAGTARRRAHLAPIGTGARDPGEPHLARIHVEGDPVPLLPGDRFIVRGFSRTQGTGGTLGGGRILDVSPPHRRRSDPALVRELELFAGGDVHDALRERVVRSGFEGVTSKSLGRETGLDPETLGCKLAELETAGSIVSAGVHWIGASGLEQLEGLARSSLEAFHEAEPLLPGMPRGTLLGVLPENAAPGLGERLISGLEAAGIVEAEADRVRCPGFVPRIDASTRAAIDRIRSDAATAGLEPPAPRDWAERLGIPLEHFRDLLAHLERSGQLVRAPGDLWFDPAAVDALEQRIQAQLNEHGELDTPRYKAIIGTSRRTAVPLMELFDERQLTRRRGNVRIPFKS